MLRQIFDQSPYFMRLILVTQDFAPEFGGIQTYCLEHAIRLNELCEDFALICPDKPNSDKVDRDLDFPVYRFKVNNSLLVFSLFRHLGSIIDKHETDATLHAQWQTTLPAIALRKKSKLNKVFCTGHGRELIFNPYKNVPMLDGLFEKTRKKSLRETDHNYPVSVYNSKMMGDLSVPEERRTVVINGTNPDKFFPVDGLDFKKKIGLEGRKIILTVTRIIYRKGVDIVIKAVNKLKKKIPDICYVVVGDGPEMHNCKDLVKSLNLDDHIRFTGRIPYEDLNPFYNMCDLFVMVPRSDKTEVEGFGIVYLEANACKKPVIGSDSAGIPSAVLHNQTGLLVEEDNIDELTSAINVILKDQSYATKLGTNGFERVRSKANWNSVSKKLFNAMDNKL